MLKRNNKAIAIVMALAICLTVIAPFFTAQPAMASSSYEALKCPSIRVSSAPQAVSTAVMVTIPELAALQATATTWDTLTLSLPTGVKLNAASFVAGAPGTATADAYITVPATVDGVANPLAIANFARSFPSSDNTYEIRIQGAGLAGKGKFVINFNNMTVQDVSGELKATFQPALSGSGFTAGSAVIANVVSGSQGTVTMAKSTKTFGDAGGSIDSLIIAEQMPGVFQPNDVIKVKLPSGFEWDYANSAALDAGVCVVGGWGAEGRGNACAVATHGAATIPSQTITAALVAGDPRSITLTLGAAFPVTTTSAGRIVIGHDGTATMLKIKPTTTTKFGDVSVNVSASGGAAGAIADAATRYKEADVVVGSYADYSVKMEEKTTTTATSGAAAVRLGSFYVKEGIQASLSQNKSIYLELPAGVHWNTVPTNTLESGVALTFGAYTPVSGTLAGNDCQTIKASVTAVSTSAAKVLIDNAKVNIDPNFSGDVKIKVYGSAGLTGDIKVATVSQRIKLESAAKKDIIIGKASQQIGDITITESVKGAIGDASLKDVNNRSCKLMYLDLDPGLRFSKAPTVKVTEGDLEIDTAKLSAADAGRLIITIKSSSTKASKITLSDVFLTSDRTTPEGDVKIKVLDSKEVFRLDGVNVSAVDESFTDKSGGDLVIANTTTPAPTEGTAGAAAGQFKISSNIYEVNGVAKVMDAAPYIKAGRTYVPVKYLGLALGVAEKDIVWDATAQKATLTLGDKKVELTIGSTSYTVNGEAKTMDVAPEINNGRTMLPAKYVAEGLGFQVGWDASTGTVLVSK